MMMLSERFTLLKDFNDFRFHVVKNFYGGWYKHDTHEKLIKAQKNFPGGEIFIREPAQYPCIVETFTIPETEEDEERREFDYLYKSNLKCFQELFVIIK
jgi:hypothetical protein